MDHGYGYHFLIDSFFLLYCIRLGWVSFLLLFPFLFFLNAGRTELYGWMDGWMDRY